MEFESALCNETDADFAVCLNSGTSALHVACLAAGVGHGDEIITPPIAFVASANCAVYCGEGLFLLILTLIHTTFHLKRSKSFHA